MKKQTVIIIILAVLLAVSNIAWAIYHNFQLQQIKPAKGWTNVLTWWGTERTSKSKTFDIVGEEWWILWTFNGNTEGARCDITVYDSYTNNTFKSVSLTYYGDKDYLNLTGSFYLTLNIYGDIDNWTIHVHEYHIL